MGTNETEKGKRRTTEKDRKRWGRTPGQSKTSPAKPRAVAHAYQDDTYETLLTLVTDIAGNPAGERRRKHAEKKTGTLPP